MKTKKPSGRGGARAGAGRPKTYKRPSLPTTVTLEQSERDALDRKATRLGLSRTAAIREAIRAWLAGRPGAR